MADTKPDPVDTAIGLVVLFVGYPLAILYGGWITTKLWAWFVVPTFDAPMISWAVAVGLELLVMHMRPVMFVKPKGETPMETYGRCLGYWFIVPTLTLIIATAVKAWFL